MRRWSRDDSAPGTRRFPRRSPATQSPSTVSTSRGRCSGRDGRCARSGGSRCTCARRVGNAVTRHGDCRRRRSACRSSGGPGARPTPDRWNVSTSCATRGPASSSVDRIGRSVTCPRVPIPTAETLGTREVVDHDAPALIMYTSGTTGLPEGRRHPAPCDRGRPRRTRRRLVLDPRRHAGARPAALPRARADPRRARRARGSARSCTTPAGRPPSGTPERRNALLRCPDGLVASGRRARPRPPTRRRTIAGLGECRSCRCPCSSSSAS